MKWKISTRILLSMLTVAVIPLLSLFFYISFRYSADLKESVLAQTRYTQQSNVSVLTDYLTKIERISNSCFDPAIQQIIRQAPGSLLERYNNQNQIERAIRVSLDLFHILDTVDMVSVSSLKGNSYNIGEVIWAAEAGQLMEAQNEHLDRVYKLHGVFPLGAAAANKLIYIRNINDTTAAEKQIGSIGIVFDRFQFAQIFAEYCKTNRAIVTVENAEGVLLYNSFTGSGDKGVAVTAAANHSSAANIIRSGYSVPSLELKVTFYDDLSVLLVPLTTLRHITAVIIICNVVLILGISMTLSNGLVRPIKRLQKSVEKVQEGDFHIDLPVRGRDELSNLCTAFNLMAGKIDFLVNEVYATQLSEKEAVIASLTSQINPHFLYNTLDMIKSMADLEGAAEIGEIAKALSGLFRYSTRNNQSIVTIREELDNLNNYIKILHARFGGNIHFDISAASDTLQCGIIKVCLQPLIENSVGHGKSQRGGHGTVSISIERVGNLIQIIEQDDGAGISPSVLLELQAALRHGVQTDPGVLPHCQTEGYTSVGLKNINERIRLCYGPEYGLEITSKPGRGTRVTITFPST